MINGPVPIAVKLDARDKPLWYAIAPAFVKDGDVVRFEDRWYVNDKLVEQQSGHSNKPFIGNRNDHY